MRLLKIFMIQLIKRSFIKKYKYNYSIDHFEPKLHICRTDAHSNHQKMHKTKKHPSIS